MAVTHTYTRLASEIDTVVLKNGKGYLCIQNTEFEITADTRFDDFVKWLTAIGSLAEPSDFHYRRVPLNYPLCVLDGVRFLLNRQAYAIAFTGSIPLTTKFLTLCVNGPMRGDGPFANTDEIRDWCKSL